MRMGQRQGEAAGSDSSVDATCLARHRADRAFSARALPGPFRSGPADGSDAVPFDANEPAAGQAAVQARVRGVRSPLGRCLRELDAASNQQRVSRLAADWQ